MEYITRELTKEEGDALTKDLQDVLEKHNAEMGVISSIQLLKRVPKEIISPFMPKDGDNTGKTKETPETN